MNNSSDKSPLVSVGMPVYKRPDGFKKALDCIITQTYKNLEIVVSNNNPEPDEVDEIIMHYLLKDSRIKYIKQQENIGAANNFRFVLDKATGAYFMFASDDDIWKPEFIEKCMALLLENPDYGLAFTNMLAVDCFGRQYRDMPGFERFEGKRSLRLIYKYIMEPEYYGKACFIFGVCKTELMRRAFNKGMDLSNSGTDYALNLFLLLHGGLLVEKEVLHIKTNKELTPEKKFQYIDIYKHKGGVSIKDFKEMYRNHLIAAKESGYYLFVKILMWYRLHFDKAIKRN